MPDGGAYLLRVTTGPGYDLGSHKLVSVNDETPVTIDSELIEAQVNVRVQNYHGIPTTSPTTSPYFAHERHTTDLYSISFSFRLKPAAGDIPGTDLVFGNDFDHPIRDSLPPGFGTAFRIVQWWIDPGLAGDFYADEPYLYGPLLSSINVLRVGDKSASPSAETSPASPSSSSAAHTSDDASDAHVASEGGTAAGAALRAQHSVPDAAAARMKFFLTERHRQEFSFEAGREYECDFFNPYLDFNEFSLKLPGFTLPIMRYWDGQPLRYVLKHRTKDATTDTPLLVVQFMLVPKDAAEEDEKFWTGKGGSRWDGGKESGGDGVGDAAANEGGGGGGGGSNVATSEDDVD